MRILSAIVSLAVVATPLISVAQPEISPAATRPTSGPAESQPSPQEAAVMDMLKEYNDAVTAGDTKKIESFIVAKTDLLKRAVGEISRLAEASGKLHTATVKKFGQQAVEAAGVTRDVFPNGFPQLPLDLLRVKVSEGKATLISREAGEQMLPLTIAESGGGWKIEADSLLPPFTMEQLDEQTQILSAVINSLKKTEEDVKAGMIAAPDEVVVLMQHRLKKAAEAAQVQMQEKAMKAAATQRSQGPTDAAPGEGAESGTPVAPQTTPVEPR